MLYIDRKINFGMKFVLMITQLQRSLSCCIQKSLNPREYDYFPPAEFMKEAGNVFVRAN